MPSIKIARDLPEEFLSDVMITAFDGGYGWSWHWFQPAAEDWLEAKHTDKCGVKEGEPRGDKCIANDLWMKVSIKVKEETGYPLFDQNPCIEVTLQDLANGMARIINDDYVGTWRKASEMEERAYSEGRTYGREYRFNEKEDQLEVETGETARGYQQELAGIIAGLESNQTDAGDIDAPFADAIVQAAVFGKVIFG